MPYKDLEKRKEYQREYHQKNKEKLRKQRRDYVKNHREEIDEYQKKYRVDNKEKLKEQRLQYNIENQESILLKKRIKYQKNKDEIKEKNNLYKSKLAKYSSWFDKLSPYYQNELRRDPKDLNLLQVRCKYCGSWMNPTNREIQDRLRSINSIDKGECHIYCSKSCKKSCPTYGKKEWEEGFKEATSREVQPELRKLVLERDNWTCQNSNCRKNKNDNPEVELHCHHIDPTINNPIESADIDNCITLCKNCHKDIHKNKPGCKYSDLRC